MRGNVFFEGFFKACRISILTIIFSSQIPLNLFSKSLYYYENFSGTTVSLLANGWNFNFPMNRYFLVDNTTNVTSGGGAQFFISNQQGNQRLILYGDPNADPIYDQWYTGKGAIFRPANNSELGNQAVNASLEEPFGFMAVRYATYVHRDPGPTYTPNNTGNLDDNYGKGLLEFWLVEDNGAQNIGDSFNNFIFLYDKAFNHNNVNNRSNNIWGYFNDYERDNGNNSPWTNLTDIDGNTMNPNTFYKRQYSFNNANGWTVTNELGIRITHNGSKAVIYLNFDPLSRYPASFSNSWIKFAETSTAWANNLAAYFAAESPTPEGNVGPTYTYTYTELGNFLIRSVASNLAASVYPQRVIAGASASFSVFITNQMGSTNDSGIGEIALKKPASFISNWNFSLISVSNIYSASCSNAVLTNTNANFNPPAGKCAIFTNSSGELRIRFNMTSGASHQIVTNNNSVVKVSFSLFTPAVPNAVGDTFEVYADCIKHADTGQDFVFNSSGIKYATTDRKKAFPAFTDALLVKTYTQPASDASVSVNVSPYYEGTAEASFIYRFDTSRNANAPDISTAAIVVPDSNFNVSNFSSLILGPLSSTYIYKTNNLSGIGAGNYIYIDYASAGMKLAGNQGFDKINFSAYGTADLPLGIKISNYIWKSYVNSDAFVGGTTWQMTTNTNYSRQFIQLISKSPKPYGSIIPAKVTINVIAASNIVNCGYSLLNGGDFGNDFVRAKIIVPPDFTNIWNIHSSWQGSHTNSTSAVFSNQAIWLSYTNTGNYKLLAGSNDTITFQAIHRITNVDTNSITNYWQVYADNENTEDYVGDQNSPGSWTMLISPPFPSGENQVLNPLIFTSDMTNTITNEIYNTSPAGVNVKLAKVVLPVWFTNILSASSSHLSNQANLVLSNIGGTNMVYIQYAADTGDGGSLLHSAYESLPADKDVLVIKTLDKIEWDSFSNTNTALTNLELGTYVYKTAAETNDVSLFTNCGTGIFTLTNSIRIEHPYVSAHYSISPASIDTTTITNNLTCQLINDGLPGNRIKRVDIVMPPQVVDTIIAGSSAFGGICSAYSNILVVSYENAGKRLTGGTNDSIDFTLVDKVDGSNVVGLIVGPKVYNDRESIFITNVISNGSGSLDFEIPKPKGGSGILPNVYFIGTNQAQDFSITVSNMGTGSDVFFKAMVNFPPAFTNTIVSVSSSWLSTNSTLAPGLFNITATNLTVVYTNKFLTVGSSDSITLHTVHSHTNVGDTNSWLISAFNGFKDGGNEFFQPLSNALFNDSNTYATEQPNINVTPLTALTTDVSNVLYLIITNGQDSRSKAVKKVRIDVPYPYRTDGIGVSYLGGKVFTSTVSASNIILDYGNAFIGNNFSEIELVVNKDYISFPTNSRWNVSVDYLDGGGYRSTLIKAGCSNSVAILLPNPTTYAAVSPKTVGKDMTSERYNITVTNYGVLGNNIQMVKILPPHTNTMTDIITNVTFISNRIGGLLTYTNGTILVQYFTSNTNLASGMADVISFNAFDNQNLPGFSDNWEAFIANTSSTDAFVPAALLVPSDTAFEVIQPSYRSDYRVTPNTLDTSYYTNSFSVQVNNTGGAGNNISCLRIALPAPFITNAILVSSTRTTNIVLTNFGGTNTIELLYSSNVFVPNSNDVVSITAWDQLDFGDTNVWINVNLIYSTSFGQTAASEVQGGTNLLAFTMPSPQVKAKIVFNEAFTGQNDFSLRYKFINTGKGSNKVTRGVVTIPSIFTNGGILLATTNSRVTNAYWNGNRYIMAYSNFISQETNEVVFYLTNQASIETNAFVSALFENGMYSNSATNDNVYDSIERIISAPSAGVSPSAVLSTDFSNTVVLTYNNNSSGSLSTLSLRIDVPLIYTNTVSASSLKGSAAISNINSTNFVYVTYSGGLSKNESDTIQLSLLDKLQTGSTNNVEWKVNADNGSGYGNTRETSSGALKQSFDMPAPEIISYFDTAWFYITTNSAPAARDTNHIRVKIMNLGEGANAFNAVKIIMPFELTNIININSMFLTNEAVSIHLASNEMIVYYTNELSAGLASSLTDTLSFDAIYHIENMGNYYYSIYAENGSSEGYVAATNKGILISFYQPSSASQMSIEENSVLYTLDTNASVIYRVQNNSFALTCQSAFVAIDTNILQISSIYSSWLAQSNVPFVYTNINGSNGVVINYSTKLIDKKASDNLTFNLAYNFSSETNLTMGGMIRFDGSDYYEKATVPDEATNILWIKVADFGRLIGWALPGSLNTAVKVVQTNTSQIQTNKFGANLIATADSSGRYRVDFIPAGTYDLVLYVNNYKDITLSSIGVISNFVTNVGTNILRHSPLNARATENQEIVSQNDGESKIIIPPNSILRNFAIDIWVTNLSDGDMKSASANNKTIEAPANPDNMTLYFVDMRDLSDGSMKEQEITNDIIVILHYNPAEISAQGWSEDKLAIYYWRSMTKEWIRIGGVVDKGAKTVTVKVSYLHQYYAIFGDKANSIKGAPGFVSVKTDPRVFTPRADDRTFKNIKISIGFEEAHDRYQVKIYNVRGNLIKSFDRSGEYKQGEVYWDGKDNEGYDVKSGIYIYRIIADDKTYSGTIIVVR